MKKKILIIVCFFSSFMLHAAVLKTVSVTVGGLSAALTATEIASVTDLTVTGSIDARDIKFMRDGIPNLAVLNLSGASIKAYTGTGGTVTASTTYLLNEMPKYSFHNLNYTGTSKLTSIILPSTTTSIGIAAFNGCTGLTQITLPSTITSIKDYAFFSCSALTSITIPNSVTVIGNNAFGNCIGLTSFTIPTSIKTISDWTFSNCTGLTGITIPNTITSIGNYAFYGCSKLTNVTIPTVTKSIGESAFGNCTAITTMNIPNSVSAIKNNTFSGCTALSSITIPNSVDSIGNWALLNCTKLTSIVIPNSVTTIGSGSFYNCTGLTSFTIPNSVTSIGDEAFFKCTGLTNITIPNSVTTISNSTFANCIGLTSIKLPSSVTSIEDWAFYDCSGLTSVTIGASTTKIGEYAFGDCVKLTTINSYLTKPIASISTVFTNVNKSTCKLYVPVNTKSIYQATASWNEFANIIEMSTSFSQNIALVSGWNIISSNVIPSDINLKNILQPLINKGKLIKVMDESGKAIENFAALGGWNNGIGNFSQTEGYRVNLSSEDTLVLNGSAVVLPLKIPLSAGWNIISYPCTNAQSAQTVVQTLINNGNLIKVMDESGKSVENYGTFGGWKNNIGSFTPGKGFKIYMAKSDSLLITSSILRSAEELASITNLESAYFTKVYEGNGTDHMNINLVNLGTSSLQLGDEIGIFDGKACVGSATIGADQITQGSISIPTSCNESVGDIVNGFIPGNTISYKLYSKGILYNMTMTNLSGSATFEKSGSIFVQFESKEISVNIPTDLSGKKVKIGIKCYPNPFVEEITIDIQNTLSEKLTVGIYNLMGQLIKEVFEGETDNIQLKWDGTDKKGNQVIPGIYVCKVNDSSMKIVFTSSK